MSEEKMLSKKLSKRLMNNKVIKNRIEFGKGNLMPLFSVSEKETRLVIAKNKEFNEIGKIIEVEKGERLAEQAKSLVMLSFPNDAVGVASIDSLKAWLTTTQKHILESMIKK